MCRKQGVNTQDVEERGRKRGGRREGRKRGRAREGEEVRRKMAREGGEMKDIVNMVWVM